jgi:hypothetical protein
VTSAASRNRTESTSLSEALRKQESRINNST